ncbi:TRASH domain-containing protein [Companilactobacillus sp. FL22-1]
MSFTEILYKLSNKILITNCKNCVSKLKSLF